MGDGALLAHSLAEAFYYLSINPCPECGSGVRDPGEGLRLEDVDGDAQIEVETTCRECGAQARTRFRLTDDESLISAQATPVINKSAERSHVIDVAQWLTLFRVTAESAASQSDRQSARLNGVEAALCLEEALKFYDDDENDLPPSEAFFSEATRQRFRDHPEQFSRRRLIELRAKLPALDVMKRVTEQQPKRPWWRLWR